MKSKIWFQKEALQMVYLAYGKRDMITDGSVNRLTMCSAIGASLIETNVRMPAGQP